MFIVNSVDAVSNLCYWSILHVVSAVISLLASHNDVYLMHIFVVIVVL